MHAETEDKHDSREGVINRRSGEALPSYRSGHGGRKPAFGTSPRPFRSKFKSRTGNKPFRGARRKSARV
jgi:hypothetical protein